MVNSVYSINSNNFSYQVANGKRAFKAKETPDKEPPIFDSVNFMSKTKEKIVIKLILAKTLICLNMI